MTSLIGQHPIDEPALASLIEESQDLHRDAMSDARDRLGELVHVIRSHRALATGAVLGAGALTLASAGSAFAADDTTVQALQTAASLENLAVATYGTALTLPYIANGNKVVKAFAMTTMGQHKEHGAAFNAMLTKLGAKTQTAANPKYGPVVTAAVPSLMKGGPADVVKLAMTLEDVATSTYVANVSLISDKDARALFASIMGVESQHLATLNAVGALLGANLADQIKLPPDAAKLPTMTAEAAIPESFKLTDKASPPAEGAVK